MLRSPTHAVVGSRDLERTASLLGRFGFEPRSRGRLSREAARALYGLEGPCSEMLLHVRGAAGGGICLVETPHAPLDPGALPGGLLAPRPIAVDLYTRHIEQSMDLCRDAGLHLGERVDYAVGPLRLKEVEAEDDDGLRLVFIEIDHRRPSVLDQAPERLHSEVHSLVFSVPDAQASLELWRDRAGLEILVDAPIEGPVISRLMGLPEPEVPVRFVLLCDAEATPARFELLQFVDHPAPAAPNRPLRAGLDGVVLTVDDLDGARERLAGCSFTPELDPDLLAGSARLTGSPGPELVRRAVGGEDPGGLRFELWETLVSP